MKNNRDWVNDDDSDEAGRIIIMGRRMEEEEEEEEREAEEERGRRRREGPVSGRAGLWARSDGGEEIQSPAGPASEQTRVLGELLQPPAGMTSLPLLPCLPPPPPPPPMIIIMAAAFWFSGRRRHQRRRVEWTSMQGVALGVARLMANLRFSEDVDPYIDMPGSDGLRWRTLPEEVVLIYEERRNRWELQAMVELDGKEKTLTAWKFRGRDDGVASAGRALPESAWDSELFNAMVIFRRGEFLEELLGHVTSEKFRAQWFPWARGATWYREVDPVGQSSGAIRCAERRSGVWEWRVRMVCTHPDIDDGLPVHGEVCWTLGAGADAIISLDNFVPDTPPIRLIMGPDPWAPRPRRPLPRRAPRPWLVGELLQAAAPPLQTGRPRIIPKDAMKLIYKFAARDSKRSPHPVATAFLSDPAVASTLAYLNRPLPFRNVWNTNVDQEFASYLWDRDLSDSAHWCDERIRLRTELPWDPVRL